MTFTHILDHGDMSPKYMDAVRKGLILHKKTIDGTLISVDSFIGEEPVKPEPYKQGDNMTLHNKVKNQYKIDLFAWNSKKEKLKIEQANL